MLTERESQVMDLFNKGWYHNQIAKELHISNGRVTQIVNAASRKLYRYYIDTAAQHGVQPTGADAPESQSDSADRTSG